MNTVVKLTDEQIKELNEIKSLINSNDEESIILGCNLILENYPSGMIDSEWYKYGSFFVRNLSVRECICDLNYPIIVNISELIKLLKNVIEQGYYIIVEEVSVIVGTEDNA